MLLELDTVISKCISAIVLLHSGNAIETQRAGFSFKKESIADKETFAAKNRQMVVTAYGQGSMLIEVVADQAIAFTKTLSNPVLTIAPWSIARSAIESAAIGLWLLDPKIDIVTRIGRSYALRYEGMIQQEKYLRAANLPENEESTAKRINEVEAKPTTD